MRTKERELRIRISGLYQSIVSLRQGGIRSPALQDELKRLQALLIDNARCSGAGLNSRRTV